MSPQEKELKKNIMDAWKIGQDHAEAPNFAVIIAFIIMSNYALIVTLLFNECIMLYGCNLQRIFLK